MARWVLLISSFFLFLFSFNANSRFFDKNQLIQRCQILNEELKELESHQYKALCQRKLGSAANKIEFARVKIIYDNYKDAQHYLSTSIEDLKFAEDVSCAFKSGITKAKMEAKAIKKEL